MEKNIKLNKVSGGVIENGMRTFEVKLGDLLNPSQRKKRAVDNITLEPKEI